MSGDIERADAVDIDDTLSECKESTWGKKVDGQFVIDGFKFKGKQPFRKAKELLVKGAQSEIDGVKFKVLDARNKGIELEIDIEILENAKHGVDIRGLAVVKFYGPNKRKENVVTITKSKESDIKYVTILAQKIIKPLIKKFLSVDDQLIGEDVSETSERGKMVKPIKCQNCEKTFNTVAGLKGHETKMHKKKSGNIVIEDKDINTEFVLTEDETDEDSNIRKKEVYKQMH